MAEISTTFQQQHSATGSQYSYSKMSLGENKRSPLLQPYCWPVVGISTIIPVIGMAYLTNMAITAEGTYYFLGACCYGL